MKDYYHYIIQSAEAVTRKFLSSQIKDRQSRDYGGLRGDYVDPKPTVYTLMSVVAVYCCEDSVYYRSRELVDPIDLSMDFIRGELRESNRFDFPLCNFSSAPDTAFILKQLFPMQQLLSENNEDGVLDVIIDKLHQLIRRALLGIRDGGFHTPNHRWAIAAALMQGYNMLQDDPERKSLKERAEQYLAEGIDGNEDGEYTERSAGNYNAVVNSALITLYEETGDAKYLDFVKRNLTMMLNYFDADDTIFTENSIRQDKGKKEYGYKYFYQYLYLVDYDYNEQFDKAAHKLISDNMDRGDEAPFCLHKLLLNRRLIAYTFKGDGFPVEYRKMFSESGILRCRKGDFVYSALMNNPNFLIMKYKEMPLIVKMGISIVSNRNFLAQKIIQTDKGYEMTFHIDGWYYLPFGEQQLTSDWRQMDHSKRQLLTGPSMDVTVLITEQQDGLDLMVLTDGYENIPVRMEILLPDQCLLTSDYIEMSGHAGDSMILKNESISATIGDTICSFGPGFGEHRFTRHYSEEKNAYNYTVYMTEYTPLKKTVSFRFY